jgi:hypothetical protein
MEPTCRFTRQAACRAGGKIEFEVILSVKTTYFVVFHKFFFYQKSEDIFLPSHDFQVRSDLTILSILREEYI